MRWGDVTTAFFSCCKNSYALMHFFSELLLHNRFFCGTDNGRILIHHLMTFSFYLFFAFFVFEIICGGKKFNLLIVVSRKCAQKVFKLSLIAVVWLNYSLKPQLSTRLPANMCCHEIQLCFPSENFSSFPRDKNSRNLILFKR